MRSTLEYGGSGTNRAVTLVLDASPNNPRVGGPGNVQMTNLGNLYTFTLSPAEARHLAAQLVAHADLAAS